MSYKSVTLSSGECKVRQLGLFELEGKARQIVGPYKYTVLLATGQMFEAEYDIRAVDVPPTRPEGEVKPESPEWYQLQEYETYIAALVHERTRIESYEGYVNDVTRYILDTCIEDKAAILTMEDWQRVYEAALTPQLTEEGLAQCLRDTFQGYIR